MGGRALWRRAGSGGGGGGAARPARAVPAPPGPLGRGSLGGGRGEWGRCGAAGDGTARGKATELFLRVGRKAACSLAFIVSGIPLAFRLGQDAYSVLLLLLFSRPGRHFYDDDDGLHPPGSCTQPPGDLPVDLLLPGTSSMLLPRCGAPVHPEKCPPTLRADVRALSHVSYHISLWFAFLLFFFFFFFLVPDVYSLILICPLHTPLFVFFFSIMNSTNTSRGLLDAIHGGHSAEKGGISVLRELTFLQQGRDIIKIRIRLSQIVIKPLDDIKQGGGMNHDRRYVAGSEISIFLNIFKIGSTFLKK